jgi:hypothetical protein
MLPMVTFSIQPDPVATAGGLYRHRDRLDHDLDSRLQHLRFARQHDSAESA